LLNLSIIEKILKFLSIILNSQCILPAFLLSTEKILRVYQLSIFFNSVNHTMSFIPQLTVESISIQFIILIRLDLKTIEII
jgi:hypothetical protein